MLTLKKVFLLILEREEGEGEMFPVQLPQACALIPD